MLGIIMFKPDFQSLHDGFRIGLVGKLEVVPFEGFDEAVRQPFNFVRRRFAVTEPIFNSLHHKTSHKSGVDSLRRPAPVYDLLVTAIQGKDNANPLAVVAGYFESVRKRGLVAVFDRHGAVMAPCIDGLAALSVRQQTVGPHGAINRFVIGSAALNIDALVTQDAPDAEMALGCKVLDHFLDVIKKLRAIGYGRWLAALSNPISVSPKS